MIHAVAEGGAIAILIAALIAIVGTLVADLDKIRAALGLDNRRHF